MAHKYKLCELCAFVVLEPHQVLVWITDRSPHYNNNTNTRQNKTFSKKEDFLNLFLHHNKSKKKNAKIYMSLLLTRVETLLCIVSSFWLSGHLFLAMQLISEFIQVNVKWNGPTWLEAPDVKWLYLQTTLICTERRPTLPLRTSDIPNHVTVRTN